MPGWLRGTQCYPVILLPFQSIHSPILLDTYLHVLSTILPMPFPPSSLDENFVSYFPLRKQKQSRKNLHQPSPPQLPIHLHLTHLLSLNRGWTDGTPIEGPVCPARLASLSFPRYFPLSAGSSPSACKSKHNKIFLNPMSPSSHVPGVLLLFIEEHSKQLYFILDFNSFLPFSL